MAAVAADESAQVRSPRHGEHRADGPEEARGDESTSVLVFVEPKGVRPGRVPDAHAEYETPWREGRYESASVPFSEPFTEPFVGPFTEAGAQPFAEPSTEHPEPDDPRRWGG